MVQTPGPQITRYDAVQAEELNCIVGGRQLLNKQGRFRRDFLAYVRCCCQQVSRKNPEPKTNKNISKVSTVSTKPTL